MIASPRIASHTHSLPLPPSLTHPHSLICFIVLACSVRYGASELHATAALIGGIAAQEAVKLITHKYLPLNNTYLYNGVAGVGGVLRV